MEVRDFEKLAHAVQRDFAGLEPGKDPVWTAPPAVRILDCVLSLNRNYDRFVVPRIAAFVARFPEVRESTDLIAKMESYPTPAVFLEDALTYRFPRCADTLRGVAEYVARVQRGLSGTTELERLEMWSRSVGPRDYRLVGVKGFGLAGFQYLRMLFGAETTKPDVHIKRYVSETAGRTVSDIEALELLEAAGSRAGVSIRWLDVAIWESRARPGCATGGAPTRKTDARPDAN